MSIPDELLAVLICPQSHQRLRHATETELLRMQDLLRRHALRSPTGKTVLEPFEGVLFREDGTVGYPVRNGIPTLLYDEALQIPLGAEA